MKTLVASLILLLLLASCKMSEEDQRQFSAGFQQAAAAADRNGDGIVTSDEAQAAGGNILVWGGVFSSLMVALRAMFKTGQAAQEVRVVTEKADRAQSQVDELYDRTHKPTAT